VKSLKNVLETARELGARKFVQYLEQAGIAEDLIRDGTFTLFAPLDHAFDTVMGGAIGGRISRSRRDPILNYHISAQKHISKEFAGNSEIVSKHNSQKLRISKYSTGVGSLVDSSTPNCSNYPALIVFKMHVLIFRWRQSTASSSLERTKRPQMVTHFTLLKKLRRSGVRPLFSLRCRAFDRPSTGSEALHTTGRRTNRHRGGEATEIGTGLEIIILILMLKLFLGWSFSKNGGRDATLRV